MTRLKTFLAPILFIYFAASIIAAESREPQSGGSTQFVELSPDVTGIDFVHPIDTKHPKKYLYVAGYASAGVAIGDLNGDGLQDIFFSGGPVPSRLYIQLADADGKPTMRFRDATAEAKVDGGSVWSAGSAFVDIDNDGDLDIYVCNYDSPNFLYLNESKPDGTLTFREAAKAHGLDIVDATMMPAFCDYDLDGDLDVFITGHQYVDPRGNPAKPPIIERDGKYYLSEEDRKYYAVLKQPNGGHLFTNVGRQDYLLQNNLSQVRDAKRMRFRNVARQAGIDGLGVGNSVAWWDFNDDGWPDIYVGNDFKVADQLFLNQRNGTFRDVVRTAFAHTTWFSMGSDVGDVNNDGRLDLFVSDMAGTNHYRSKVTMGEMSVNAEFLKTAEPRQLMRNALFINTGTPYFLEAAYMAGVANSDWTWAAKLLDLDNDGWLDLYLTNGAARMFNHSDRHFSTQDRIGKTQWDMWEDTEPRYEENLAFRNVGDLQFQNVSQPWGLFRSSMSYAAASGDLDNDGDLDLVVVNLDEPISLYENRTKGQNFLRVRLRGRANNRFGLGAKVTIHIGDESQTRVLNPMTGFMSCNEPYVHFGIGDHSSVDRLTVTWLGGNYQIINQPQVNRTLTIEEPRSYQRAPEKPAPARLFRPSGIFPALKHVEQDYDDFARQPLLPNRHSQLGPGVAVSDIDGDDDFDLYLGRAKGSRRGIYNNQGKAKLKGQSVNVLSQHADREDLGMVFFDVDRDGDQDLYVVSGSVECEPGDETLQDRLYINDGKGNFTIAQDDALPDMRDSGSVVCASDFDRDGDLDLFVGSRLVPGQYPVTPVSHLLRNDSRPGRPKLVDAAAEIAVGLKNVGLVTGALWSDANGDGWTDLFVTCDWGPVKYFQNELVEGERRLVDRTNAASLAGRVGWWNGIAGRDLDNDGDTDYVVTNFGLNTKYHPTEEKPELLFYGDFDNTGKPHLVEAKYEQGKCFPRRGLSCSSHAMPFIREKVKTFHNFGLSTLTDIYSESKLQSSLQLAANHLESGVLWNESTDAESDVPTFRFESLPRLAQISPAFGVVLNDFDADGWTDCFLAQNFYSPQHETGRMDSGLSLVLRGSRDGFIPAWPLESGLVVPGDAKAACCLDFNEDGWPDLLVTVNNGIVAAFEGQRHYIHRLLRVRLKGPSGNLDAVGARLRLDFHEPNAPVQIAEVSAGSGYLSQGEPVVSFGCGAYRPERLTIYWPNGERSEHAVPVNQDEFVFSQPSPAQP